MQRDDPGGTWRSQRETRRSVYLVALMVPLCGISRYVLAWTVSISYEEVYLTSRNSQKVLKKFT
jgi:hypothetical protein